MKLARVLVTTQCNLKCSYCCNKIPEIQKSFSMTTMDEFVERAKEYDVVNISGGEPLLSEDKLTRLVEDLYTHSNAKIYLYTNGTVLPKSNSRIYRILNGVSIGVHNNFNKIRSNVILWRHEVVFGTIRLLIRDTEVTKEIEDFCRQNDIVLVTWKLNDCNKTQEDRFII